MGKPWVKKINHKGATKTKQETVEEEEKMKEPILRIAASEENPIKCAPTVAPGPGEASLLWHFWNTQQDVLSTNKKGGPNPAPIKKRCQTRSIQHS